MAGFVNRLILLGRSVGGAIEILHAAVEHSARIVFMMCAGYDESLWSVFDVGGESGADRIPGLRTGVRC